MKTILLSCLLILMIAPVHAQSGKEKRERQKQESYDELKSLVESMNYTFEARRVYPMQGSSIDLISNPGYIHVTDSLAEAHLPFFGRAYHVEYGAPGGIEFDGGMQQYKMEEDQKKNRITISFRVRTPNDSFDCFLTANSTKNVSLTVVSQNRESINYSGVLEGPVATE